MLEESFVNKNIIHSQAFDEQFMSYSTFCVHRGGNIIDSPRNIGLPRLTILWQLVKGA